MATEAGTDYSGVLCGRATWKDGMPIYATKGVKALEDWLSTEGVKNINAVNAALKGATPWTKKLGLGHHDRVGVQSSHARRFCCSVSLRSRRTEADRSAEIRGRCKWRHALYPARGVDGSDRSFQARAVYPDDARECRYQGRRSPALHHR